MTTGAGNKQGETFNKNERTEDVRMTNIKAAKGIADIMRTSLGPKGMDKMIITGKGQLLITNDGATILDNLQVLHPTAKILVEASKAQDIEAGDGTTSVVILAGALLNSAEELIKKGIHPTTISEGYSIALRKAITILNDLAMEIDLNNSKVLQQIVKTSLSSKIISNSSIGLSKLAIEAVMRLYRFNNNRDIDLHDIKIVKKLGGTIEDAEISDGLIFTDSRPSAKNNGPTKIENPKIAMIQFCVSSPKTDIENNIKLGDYTQIDKVLKEERRYILGLVKKIADSGANVLFIQKSILRDAVNDLSLHFLAKKGIMVIRDVERTDVEFICKTVGCKPVAHIDQLTPEKLGTAVLANVESQSDGTKLFRISKSKEDDIIDKGETSTILLRGSNNLVLDEAERSIHDALCVMRSIVKNNKIVSGGGAIEIELSRQLEEYSQVLKGADNLIVRKFSEALESIPFTLAENCGMDPIKTVTEIRNRHKNGQKECGIKGKTLEIVENTREEKILQPITVNESSLKLATETVKMILKIDDIVMCR